MIFDAINVLGARSATSTTAGLRSADPVIPGVSQKQETSYFLENLATNLLAPYLLLTLSF